MPSLFRLVFTFGAIIGFYLFLKDTLIELVSGNLLAIFYPSVLIVSLLALNELVDRLKQHKHHSSTVNQ